VFFHHGKDYSTYNNPFRDGKGPVPCFSATERTIVRTLSLSVAERDNVRTLVLSVAERHLYSVMERDSVRAVPSLSISI
jgi:hypothetical protein